MKIKPWIITGAACLICLGAGTGIGLFLGQNSHNPAEPALLGQSNPIPVGTEAPVLLGGIKGVGGADDATVPGSSSIQNQLDSLAQKLDILAGDFNTLTAQFKQEAAARDEWLAVRQSTKSVTRSEKEKTVKVPSGFAAACEELGVKLTVTSGDIMSIRNWTKALDDISAGLGVAQTKLTQTLENLKSKLAQYEQTAYEYHTTEQKAGPGVRIIHADMAPLMKTVVDWAEELVSLQESE